MLCRKVFVVIFGVVVVVVPAVFDHWLDNGVASRLGSLRHFKRVQCVSVLHLERIITVYILSFEYPACYVRVRYKELS